MKDTKYRPILFNTEMVKAILDGRKTQTRRIVKGIEKKNVYRVEPAEDAYDTLYQWDFLYGWSENGAMFETIESINAPCAVGDILYVRETWCDPCPGNPCVPIVYKADMPMHFDAIETAHEEPVDLTEKDFKWKPSIHMPKEYARIFLRVKDVRVERLRDTGNTDAIAEGFDGTPCDHGNANPALGCTDCLNTGWLEPPYAEFAQLWDTTIKPYDRDSYGWDANPWVWVIEFERCEEPKEW